jgi:chemotaxis protein MotB
MMRWLLTYADMITLLMAFFILMYSMSIINLSKFKQVAISIRSGFGGSLEGGSGLLTHPIGQRAIIGEQFPQEGKSIEEVAGKLEEYIKERDLSQAMRVTIEERGLVISLSTDNLLFPIGSAQMRPAAEEILHEIAGLLQSVSNKVLVEGDLPIRTAEFPSNWELSTARASRVVRYLIEGYGIESKRFAAAGYADTKPTVPNTSEENRRRNRRVNIVILTDVTSAAAPEM